jgi:predicted kinase
MADDWQPVSSSISTPPAPQTGDDWQPVSAAPPMSAAALPADDFRPVTFDSHDKAQQAVVQNTSLGSIWRTFSSGYREAFGDEPLGMSDENIQWFRDHGFFRKSQYGEGINGVFRAFNEGVFYNGAQVLDYLSRGTRGLFRGAGAAAFEAGAPRDIAGIIAGEYVPEGAFGVRSARNYPLPPTPRTLAHARDLGVIGPERASVDMAKPIETAVEAARSGISLEQMTPSFDEGKQMLSQALNVFDQGEKRSTWVPVPEAGESGFGIYLRQMKHGDQKVLTIANVRFEQRGTGAFTAYLDHLEREAAARGYTKIEAENIENPRLERFLRDRGYKEEEGLPSFGGLPTLSKEVKDIQSRENLRKQLESGASISDLNQHPYVKKAIADQQIRLQTGTLADFENPEWRAARVFDVEGERVQGYDAAIPRLIDQAKSFSGGEIENLRHATIIIGPPASGKSTIAQPIARQTRSALVDADEAKKIIPEYQGGLGTSAVHEESSVLAAHVLEELVAQGANIVLPKVGEKVNRIREISQGLKEAGYSVDLVHVSVPHEVSARRNIQRFLDTGRLVPPDYLASVSGKTNETYHILKGEGLFRDTLNIDTTAGRKILDGEGPLSELFQAERNYGPGTREGDQASLAADQEEIIARPSGPPRTMAAERIGDEVIRGPEPEAKPNSWREQFDQFVGKIKTDQDVKDLLTNAADENDNFPAAREGKIPLRQVESLADAAGVEPTTVNPDGVGRLLQNDNMVRNAMQAMLQATEDVKAAAREARLDGSTENLQKLQEAMLRRDTWVEQVVGHRAEWGRTGNVFQEFLQRVKDERSFSDFMKDQGRTPDGLKKIADALDGLDPNQIPKFLSDANKPSFADKAWWYWMNALISGPVTHAKYMVANAVFAGYEGGLVTPVAGAVGAVRRGLTGGREGVFTGEAGPRLWGLVAGVPDALQAAVKAVKTGLQTPLPGEVAQNIIPKQNVAFASNIQPIPGWFGKIIGIPSRGASGIHSFFNSLGYRASIEAQAYRQAVKEGLNPAQSGPPPVADGLIRFYHGTSYKDASGFTGKTFVTPHENYARNYHGSQNNVLYTDLTKDEAIARGLYDEINNIPINGSIDDGAARLKPLAPETTGDSFWQRKQYWSNNPTPEMMTLANEEGYRLTYISELSPAMKAVSNAVRKVPGGRFIMPFLHIPFNILTRATEGSPLAFLPAETRADLKGANGAVKQDMAVARLVVGSAVGAWAMNMILNDRMTGFGPTDQKERDQWLATGHQPYSVRIGDYWYSFNRFGSIGTMLGLYSNLGEALPHIKPDAEEATKAVAMTVHATGRLLEDEVGMQGLAGLMGAIDEPDRKGARYVSSFAGSWLPFSSLLRQTASAMDPYMRETKSVVDGLRYYIPTERQGLNPKRDWLGQPIANAGYGGDIPGLPGASAIIQHRAAEPSPLALEMKTLDLHPAPPEDRIAGVKLTPALYDRYQATAGPITQAMLEHLMEMPNWNSLPPVIRQEAFQKAIGSARKAAQVTMQVQYPALIQAAVDQRINHISGEQLSRSKKAPASLEGLQ